MPKTTTGSNRVRKVGKVWRYATVSVTEIGNETEVVIVAAWSSVQQQDDGSTVVVVGTCVHVANVNRITVVGNVSQEPRSQQPAVFAETFAHTDLSFSYMVSVDVDHLVGQLSAKNGGK